MLSIELSDYLLSAALSPKKIIVGVVAVVVILALIGFFVTRSRRRPAS
jgi:hypothetical protein